MSLWKLGTLVMIIGASTTFFAILLKLTGSLNILSLAALAALFNIAQWLFAPYIINAIYKVKEAKPNEFPNLHTMMEKLSRRSGIKKPKLAIAYISIPNAFAYGSPLTGNLIAVTKELLDTLEEGEVEAVLGHELGHLKHSDAQIMMLVSFLPSLFYLIGRSALFSAYFRGYYERNRQNSGGIAILVGMASMGMYFMLLLFTLALSRLREYYADRHSAFIVEEGPQKLSKGLVKIISKTRRIRQKNQETLTFNGFKTLFISDPENVEDDTVEIENSLAISSDRELIDHLLRRRITMTERLMELFSTHPNITKRLRALKALESQKGGTFSG